MNNIDTQDTQAAEASPIEKLIEIFVEESGLPWPKHWNGDKPEKWLDPLVAIDKACGSDLYLRETAVREAVAKCRNNGILVSSPYSILSTALQLLHVWRQGKKNDPSEAEFTAYRNRVISLGYAAIW